MPGTMNVSARAAENRRSPPRRNMAPRFLPRYSWPRPVIPNSPGTRFRRTATLRLPLNPLPSSRPFLDSGSLLRGTFSSRGIFLKHLGHVMLFDGTSSPQCGQRLSVISLSPHDESGVRGRGQKLSVLPVCPHIIYLQRPGAVDRDADRADPPERGSVERHG